MSARKTGSVSVLEPHEPRTKAKSKGRSSFVLNPPNENCCVALMVVSDTMIFSTEVPRCNTENSVFNSKQADKMGAEKEHLPRNYLI